MAVRGVILESGETKGYDDESVCFFDMFVWCAWRSGLCDFE